MQWNDSIALCIFKKIRHWEDQSVTGNSKINQNLKGLNPTGTGFKSSPFHLASSPASRRPAGLDSMMATLLGTDFKVAPCQAPRWQAWVVAPAGWPLRPHRGFPASSLEDAHEDKDIFIAAYLFSLPPPELFAWNPRSGTKPAAFTDGCCKKQL